MTENRRGTTDRCNHTSVLSGSTRFFMALTTVGDRETGKRTQHEPGTGKSAFLIALGILLSRIVGLVRGRLMAHFFGVSDAADAFNAAFRIPNLLQNLFGEGVLSASFIPIYANLLARGEEKEAGKVAGAIAGLLSLAVSLFVLAGVLAAPTLTYLLAPGFVGAKRELTVTLVRTLFPGAGVLVLSAWCLGVLNSHRRFFLSYAAPIIWNLSMITTLVVFGPGREQYRLAELLAWGSVVGSTLQFAIQLPTVLRLAPHLRISINARLASVRAVLSGFVPVFISRGVVQISAYADNLIASLLGTGAVTGLTYAQNLYLLPVSLFGMSMSAAELPAMSSAVGTEDEIAMAVRTRLDSGLRRIAFFIVPSAMVFLALGDVVTGAIYQSGEFSHADAVFVWGVLAGSAVGLLASTLGRLYSSAYYALRDTRTPLNYAVVRIAITVALGYLLAVPLPPMLGIEERWGVAGLTAAAGAAGWVEFALLRRRLNHRIGTTGLPLSFIAKLWGSAIVAGAVAWGIKLAVGTIHPLLLAVLVLVPYALVYVATTTAFGMPEARSVSGQVLRLVRGRRRGA